MAEVSSALTQSMRPAFTEKWNLTSPILIKLGGKLLLSRVGRTASIGYGILILTSAYSPHQSCDNVLQSANVLEHHINISWCDNVVSDHLHMHTLYISILQPTLAPDRGISSVFVDFKGHDSVMTHMPYTLHRKCTICRDCLDKEPWGGNHAESISEVLRCRTLKNELYATNRCRDM